MSDALIRAGIRMSNALYNLANDRHLVGLDDHTRNGLSLLQEEWDSELKLLRCSAASKDRPNSQRV